MRPGGRASALIELLGLVRCEWHPKGVPADRVLSRYFRDRRFVGGGDRRWISDAVYDLLRHWRQYQHIVEFCGLPHTDRSYALVWLADMQGDLDRYFGSDEKYAPPAITPIESGAVAKLDDAKKALNTAPETIKYSIPDCFAVPLRERFGENFAAECAAIKESAPLDIRLNKLKGDKEPPVEGDPWEPHRMAPDGYRAFGFPRLVGLESYRGGVFEIQDEASQICAVLVNAKPGMTVLDQCAGAGGKALAIASEMANKGRVIAADTSKRRLDQADIRAKRAGATIIKPLLLKADRNARLSQIQKTLTRADRVLVDAPCSGSGIWRRNPGQKWHYSAADLDTFHALQLEILTDAKGFVADDGLLIYATCSLFIEENERTVEAFLKANDDFDVVPVSDQWARVGLGDMVNPSKSTDPRYLQLTPASHDTDGFFVAILKRR